MNARITYESTVSASFKMVFTPSGDVNMVATLSELAVALSRLEPPPEANWECELDGDYIRVLARWRIPLS